MNAYQERNKAPLKLGTPDGDKALQEIHQAIMAKNTETGGPLLETKVPDGFRNSVLRGNPQATDDEITYEWKEGQSLKYFNDLYAARKERYARIRGGFRPGAIRGTMPVVGQPDTGPQPTGFEQSQQDPIVQFLQKIGGKAVGDWLETRAKEIATGATKAQAALKEGSPKTGEETVKEAP
jgi:hypothetical protein